MTSSSSTCLPTTASRPHVGREHHVGPDPVDEDGEEGVGAEACVGADDKGDDERKEAAPVVGGLDGRPLGVAVGRRDGRSVDLVRAGVGVGRVVDVLRRKVKGERRLERLLFAGLARPGRRSLVGLGLLGRGHPKALSELDAPLADDLVEPRAAGGVDAAVGVGLWLAALETERELVPEVLEQLCIRLCASLDVCRRPGTRAATTENACGPCFAFEPAVCAHCLACRRIVCVLSADGWALSARSTISNTSAVILGLPAPSRTVEGYAPPVLKAVSESRSYLGVPASERSTCERWNAGSAWTSSRRRRF